MVKYMASQGRGGVSVSEITARTAIRGGSNDPIDFGTQPGTVRSINGDVPCCEDKSTFAPGEKITISGFLWWENTDFPEPDQNQARALANVPVTVRLRNPNGSLQSPEQVVNTNANGRFEATFTLAANAAPGSYQMEADYAGTTVAGFVPVAPRPAGVGVEVGISTGTLIGVTLAFFGGIALLTFLGNVTEKR